MPTIEEMERQLHAMQAEVDAMKAGRQPAKRDEVGAARLTKAIFREVATTYPHASADTVTDRAAKLAATGAYELVGNRLRPCVERREALAAARQIDQATVTRLASASAELGGNEVSREERVTMRLAAMGLAPNVLDHGGSGIPDLGFTVDDLRGGGNDAA